MKIALLAGLFLALGLAIGLWVESSEQRRLGGMAQKMRERR